jgi:hypothetical protein
VTAGHPNSGTAGNQELKAKTVGGALTLPTGSGVAPMLAEAFVQAVLTPGARRTGKPWLTATAPPDGPLLLADARCAE